MSISRCIMTLLAVAAGAAPPLAMGQPAGDTARRDQIGPDVVRYCGPAIQDYARLAGEDSARWEVTNTLSWYFGERNTIDKDGRPTDIRRWNDEAALYEKHRLSKQSTDKRAVKQAELGACLLGRAMALSGPDSGYLAIGFKGDLGGTIYRIVGDQKHMLCTGTMEQRPCFVQLRANETYELQADVSRWSNNKSQDVGVFSRTFTMRAGDSDVWMPAEGQ